MRGLNKFFFVVFLFIASICPGQDSMKVNYYNTVLVQRPLIVKLPPPDTIGGKPLMQCLKERKSTRSFDSRSLSPKVMSNLVWAAFGVNRPDGRRTAPSAMNRQEIDVYVAMQDGLFIYDPSKHLLKQISKENIKGQTGTQGFVKDAPIDIIYVADFSKIEKVSQDEQTDYAYADCGFIAQNVYLYCASEGLACVVRASIDRIALSKAMNLGKDQRIILSQTVGYSK